MTALDAKRGSVVGFVCERDAAHGRPIKDAGRFQRVSSALPPAIFITALTSSFFAPSYFKAEFCYRSDDAASGILDMTLRPQPMLPSVE